MFQLKAIKKLILFQISVSSKDRQFLCQLFYPSGLHFLRSSFFLLKGAGGVLQGILGGGVPPGSPNPPFFLREFFSRALLSERLEQATLQETTGIPACLPPPPPRPYALVNLLYKST